MEDAMIEDRDCERRRRYRAEARGRAWWRGVWAHVSVFVGVMLAAGVAHALDDDGDGDFQALLMEHFWYEPSVREVQRAALRATGLDANPTASWSGRARHASYLPQQLTVEWVQRSDRASRDEATLTDDFDESYVLTDVTERELSRRDVGDRHDIRLRAQWDLRGTVWHRDILAVANASRDHRDERMRVLLAVTDAYFLRRAAQIVLLLSPPDNAVDRAIREMELDAMTASLDAWTAGWFSAESGARRSNEQVR